MIVMVAGCEEAATSLRDALRPYADARPEGESEEHRVQLKLAIKAHRESAMPLAAFKGRPLFPKQQPVMMTVLECQKLRRSIAKSLAMASSNLDKAA